MSEPPQVVVQQNGSAVGVARSLVDALRTSPIILLVVLLNISFALSAGWYLTGIENKRSEVIKLILDRCLVEKR